MVYNHEKVKWDNLLFGCVLLYLILYSVIPQKQFLSQIISNSLSRVCGTPAIMIPEINMKSEKNAILKNLMNCTLG